MKGLFQMNECVCWYWAALRAHSIPAPSPSSRLWNAWNMIWDLKTPYVGAWAGIESRLCCAGPTPRYFFWAQPTVRSTVQTAERSKTNWLCFKGRILENLAQRKWDFRTKHFTQPSGPFSYCVWIAWRLCLFLTNSAWCGHVQLICRTMIPHV